MQEGGVALLPVGDAKAVEDPPSHLDVGADRDGHEDRSGGALDRGSGHVLSPPSGIIAPR